jgi:histidine triad (HIT) family protein
MSEDCLFCKFIKDEIKPVILYEDNKCIVIMDKFPITKGQVLIIGKPHIDYIFDLDDETYNHIFNISKKIAKAIDKSLGTERTWVLIQGMEVRHNHIKLYPIYENVFINLNEGSGEEQSDEELIKTANLIKKEL